MQSKSGFSYFLSGFSLITTKGLKRFVFIPLIVNLLLFSVAFYFLYGQIGEGITWLMSLIPEWLGYCSGLGIADFRTHFRHISELDSRPIQWHSFRKSRTAFVWKINWRRRRLVVD